MALMSGFARIGNNEIIVLVNDAEKGSDTSGEGLLMSFEVKNVTLARLRIQVIAP
ncbi:hypothetical protein NC653_014011 [Populus alba x Populus x berolinensis]|uniref:Uncharacterized protein n=1 Tax=Populus alba x Populus x berolinensis TaxID=444605 RepID=A0AAD6QVY9_9ROSI|nr:hypothetical protein NC653_014011 [Populus alba x Populus x berolinensis]